MEKSALIFQGEMPRRTSHVLTRVVQLNLLKHAVKPVWRDLHTQGTQYTAGLLCEKWICSRSQYDLSPMVPFLEPTGPAWNKITREICRSIFGLTPARRMSFFGHIHKPHNLRIQSKIVPHCVSHPTKRAVHMVVFVGDSCWISHEQSLSDNRKHCWSWVWFVLWKC